MRELKIATWIALPVLLVATYFEHYWVWGLLFIYWGVVSIMTSEAFLVEPLHRGQDTVLFWLVTAMWIGFGTWYVIADLTWRF